MDTGLADMQRCIALLQERRTAVVSAAVTGQIDVRPIVALEAAPIDSAAGRFVAETSAAHLAWVSATVQAGDIELLS
ncbi:MAG: hypothetical protein V4463_12645 [Pseudomonadota bacterium]|jgi:hypothetical protein